VKRNTRDNTRAAFSSSEETLTFSSELTVRFAQTSCKRGARYVFVTYYRRNDNSKNVANIFASEPEFGKVSIYETDIVRQILRERSFFFFFFLLPLLLVLLLSRCPRKYAIVVGKFLFRQAPSILSKRFDNDARVCNDVTYNSARNST